MRLPALFLFLLLLYGCVDMTTEADCIGLADAESYLCYHEAAIAHATFARHDPSEKQEAVRLCNQVPSSWRGPTGEYYTFGKTQHTACIMDVASITGDRSICAQIDPTKVNDTMEKICREETIEPRPYECMATPLILLALLLTFTIYRK